MDHGDSLKQIDCNDDYSGIQSRIRFNAVVGVTYLFMVAFYNTFLYPDEPAGNLVFNLYGIPPLVEVELTVDSRGTASQRTGTATLSETSPATSRPTFTSMEI